MIVRLASDQDVPGLVALAGQVGPWFGPMASDPVVSRLVKTLAAIRAARAAGRERAWALAGDAAPGAGGGPVVIDLDATIVIAHSEKEQARPTWKKTFGITP